MKYHFITFGNEPWHRSVDKLCAEARELGIFDVVQEYTEFDLSEEDRAYAESNPRGYGFWRWKPTICLKHYESIEDGDVVLYADAGCVFNSPAKQRLLDYKSMALQHNLVTFQMTHIEKMWTKRELLQEIGCESRLDVLNSGQIEGTAFVFAKTPFTGQFLRTWDFLSRKNPVLINDEITIPQLSEFREHRHDQSIFSLLAKLTNVKILGWETWCWSDHESEYSQNPIWEKRRKIVSRCRSPNTYKKFKFFDVVYTDSKEYVVIAEETDDNRDIEIHLKTRDEYKPFELIKDPEGTVRVYKCSHDIHSSTIHVLINETEYELNVSTFPSTRDNCIMTTLVWKEDDYILQWIRYHKALGITKFIIYDNVPYKSTLETTLEEYLNDNTVILIKWPFVWGKPEGEGAQQTHQNHAIHTFSTSKWIGLFDVDEYINPQTQPHNIPTILDDILEKTEMQYDMIGGIRFVSKIFINSENQDETGYNFLKIPHCTDYVVDSRWKYFVNPKNIHIFSVHQISIGSPPCFAPKEIIYFNHYMFLNKKTPSTGNYNHWAHQIYRNTPAPCFDDTIQTVLDAISISE